MAENSLREVLLCRGIVEHDTTNVYLETFKNAGFTCKHLPVLDFRFINLENLATRLLVPESYSGLILTSQRAIEAIVKSLDARGLPELWKISACYCVGPATSRSALERLRMRECRGSDCGNSRELANLLVTERSPVRFGDATKPLLYPCSVLARDTIEVALRDARVNFEKVVVYETTPGATLDDDLAVELRGTPRIFVFFSPSTVEFTLNAAKRRELATRDIRAVAIGPATAEALERAGLVVSAVSARPEPVALLEAITDALNDCAAAPAQ